MDILRNILELQFSASHAQTYHASNAENPIFQNSSVLPNIRRKWKSLAKKLALTTKWCSFGETREIAQCLLYSDTIGIMLGGFFVLTMNYIL